MFILRALLSFLALPPIVAGVLPFLLARAWGDLRPLPAALARGALGLALLVTCTVEFATRGRGTLAPWDPPRALAAAAFHVRVVRWEEPRLARAFGAQWHDYRARVPRWLPRWRPRNDAARGLSPPGRVIHSGVLGKPRSYSPESMW